MFSPSSRKRKSKYRSARAVRPPTHVVTQWTKVKVALVCGGALILGTFMLLPLYLMELPTEKKASSASSSHVGMGSLMQDSHQIRSNWKHFVDKEKSLIRQELEQDLPLIFHHAQEEPDEYRVPVETLPPQQPHLGRGVAGLPLSSTPALYAAKKGHVDKCPEVDGVSDLIYWNDPQGVRDLNFHTPFERQTSDHPGFVSFESDLGGWNNIRMAFETIVVFAAATGRTLILPPSSPFYLLAWGEQGARTFGSFYDMDLLARRIKIISTSDFLEQHGKSILGLTDEEMKDLAPLAKLCLHRDNERETNCDRLYEKFRPSGYQPPIHTSETCVIFDERAFHHDDAETVPEDTHEAVTRFCGEERTPWYYNSTFANHDLIHWQAGDLEYRLLCHFYTTFYFTNPAIDQYFKRLVRDAMHYRDEIVCAAGKIVQDLTATFGTFSTWHVRRGDFQYKNTRLSIEEWYENTKDVIQDGEALYIATDELNRTFFEPLTETFGHSVRFLSDYASVTEGLDETYLGMVDTIVASRGRTFTGTWFSTFTGYINRIRGYSGYSMKDSWYSFLERKDRVHKWAYPFGNYVAREWPVAWTGIDGDEWIEHETIPEDEENAESELAREAGLGDEAAKEEQEEGEEVELVPVDRKFPQISLSDLAPDVDYQSKPVARGLSGRSLAETPGVEGASRAHVKCDINVDSAAYWNDPQGQRDVDFKSPFAVEGDKEKYITFGIDRGGWNNVRMSMEIIFIVALVSGRTLVLPPEIKLYLLHHDQGKKTRSFADFFPLHTEEFRKRLKIITMTEFIEREGGPDGRVPVPEGENGTVVRGATDHCEQRLKSPKSCLVLNAFLESSGRNPGFRAEDGCVVFDPKVYASTSDVMDADAVESMQAFCGKRNVTFWTKELNEPTLIHFHTDNKKYRLLTHFYSMLHFTDPAMDHYVKRFVRDFLHYHDAIYCAAGKIVKALQYEAMQRGHSIDEEGGGGYSAMHIRRGDLQYKKVKIPAKEWWNNTKEIWKEDEIIYLATDERNRTWFNPLARKRTIRFLDDYWDLADLGSLDPNYMGMIDTIVASRARAFAGTWFSTFSGYINRMRGYHGLSMMDSWYSFLSRKTALHTWVDVDHYAYAYEWPTGWNGIDADVLPSKDKF